MGNTQTSTLTPTAEYFKQRNCLWCNKKLRPFGSRRFDWSTRKYHNTCHKLYVDNLIVKREIENIKHEALYREMIERENARLRDSVLKII